MDIQYFLKEYQLVLAFLLDLLLGDPARFPHPVKMMGWWIFKLETVLRKKFNQHLKFAGILLNLATVLPAYLIPVIMISISDLISPVLGALINIFLIYTAISVKSLILAGNGVIDYLKAGQIEKSRIALQEIVSRDTSKIDKNQIIRGAIETTAENISDGIIAPLFFAALGGAPLVMAYKAVNTLDSMVGYKNEKYISFGWFSAKIDDIANFIPTRITGMLIVIIAVLTGKHPWLAAKSIWRDGQKGPSPNGGIPICGIAGALDIRLGGQCFDKNGSVIDIPFVGGDRKELKYSDFCQTAMFATTTPFAFIIFYQLLKYFLLTFHT